MLLLRAACCCFVLLLRAAAAWAAACCCGCHRHSSTGHWQVGEVGESVLMTVYTCVRLRNQMGLSMVAFRYLVQYLVTVVIPMVN